MNKTELKAVLGTLAFASCGAYASLATTGTVNVDREVTFRDSMDSVPDFYDAASPDVFTAGSYDLSSSYTSADHQLVDHWSVQSTGTVIATDQLYSIDVGVSTVGRTTRETVRADRAQVVNDIGIVSMISVTGDTAATISFGGFDSGLSNPRSRNEVIFTISSELGSFTDFSAGFNTGAQVTDPFSFDTVLLDGDVITVAFSMRYRIRQDNDVQDFSQSLSTNFSIQTVPAPSSAAALGLFGLAATRRRRA